MSAFVHKQPKTGQPHSHDPIGHYPHCRGCGTYFCKTCEAYGDHASDEPHPRTQPSTPPTSTTTAAAAINGTEGAA